MEKRVKFVIALLILVAAFAFAGMGGMVHIYFNEHMYLNYALTLEASGRTIGVHLGILFTAITGLFILWIAYRIYAAETQWDRSPYRG